MLIINVLSLCLGGRWELNPRPLEPQSSALTPELHPPFSGCKYRECFPIRTNDFSKKMISWLNNCRAD